MQNDTYQQPEKNEVRETVLTSAVRCLTKERSLSCIVRPDELADVVRQFCQYTKQVPGFRDIEVQTMDELSSWQLFHNLEVGSKSAGTLKVLYLCGPEPLNDLSVLLKEGICIHNVWAITSREDHESAINQCAEANIPLKIHPGSLKEFFDTFNQTFDIIYFDACGPFCGGRPNTLDPVVSMFDRQRLNSPGVLITNFCEPPDDGAARSRFVDIVTGYFAPRYRDLPQVIHERGPDPAIAQHEPELLRHFATHNLGELYSEFISKFLVDLGMNVLPSIKALGTENLFRRYLANDTSYKQVLAAANEQPSTTDLTKGDIQLSPSTYPILSFFRYLEQSQPNDPILQRLTRPGEANKMRRIELIEAQALMNAVVEGHWDALSDTLRESVRLSWFDYRMRLTCDLPMANLTVNALLGVYGRPSFLNPRVSQRFSYRAKTRRMYCDLLVFDQCRTFYDWFPTVEACTQRFQSVPFQIVARGIMDRIGWHGFSFDSHPFRGSAVAGWGEITAAQPFDMPERVVI